MFSERKTPHQRSRLTPNLRVQTPHSNLGSKLSATRTKTSLPTPKASIQVKQGQY